MRRLPELDALRAIAAIVVISLHAGILARALRFPLLMMWGATAVDLFFVISGYLITMIVLNEGESKHFFWNFYIRRSLRIWPIYYLAISAFAVANLVLAQPFPMDGLPYYLTYTQNVQRYWFGQEPSFCKAFAHTWSLAVEEQFYLIWPALVRLVGRRRLVPLTAGLMVLAIVARGWWQLDPQLLVTRCDGLALGGLLAALFAGGDAALRSSKRLRLAFGAIGIGSLFYLLNITIKNYSGFDETMFSASNRSPREGSFSLFGFNLLFFSIVGLCVCLSGQGAMRLLRIGALSYLGRISYGLYLYHNLILALAQKATGSRELSLPTALIALAATLAVAALSWTFVERPLLALKDRFAYCRQDGPRIETPGLLEGSRLGPAT
jgi:peptidoglycan/LPS O-acetylase OafA/YrhL